MYKSPDISFGVLDPEGLGYLSLGSFLSSYVASRCGLTPEEIHAYFEMQSIFSRGDGRLSYTKFRELFFPQMTLAGEDQHVLDNRGRVEVSTAE